MKKNFPVTGNEKPFAEGKHIISATNAKGIITTANDYFVEMSGFNEDELVGVNHNVVRHPDMPPAAFADLWDTIKTGHPWMGIVKNRCKNGDHYWVDGYVTPLLEGNELVGYESVRTKPTRERVERAEKIYQRINAGKAPFHAWQALGVASRMTLGLAALFAVVFFILNVAGGLDWISSLLGFALSTATGWFMSNLLTRPLRMAAAKAREVIDNPLMQLVYTGRLDEVGQVELTRRFQRSRITTILERAGYSAGELSGAATETAQAMHSASESLARQQMETEQVATAVNEMSATVNEVAGNTVNAAEAAGNARTASDEGHQVVLATINAIRTVAEEVERVALAIEELKNDSEGIYGVVSVISGIAEQTNLLALNAAIEAARAGEQGRGFAVVADEVRTLASRTQESTLEITSMIEKLQSGASSAVKAMGSGRDKAQAGVEQAAKAEQALDRITQAVKVIEDMNTQIASAAEEQTAVAEEINRNVNNISGMSSEVTQSVSQTTQASEQLAQLATEMQTMVKQFAKK